MKQPSEVSGTEPAPRHKRGFFKRVWGFLVILFIFGLGLIAGLFVGFTAGRVTLFHDVVKGGPVSMREAIYQRAVVDLGLDYGQKEELRLILKETSNELDKATTPMRPTVEEILGRAEQRIRVLLNKSQQGKFDRFMEGGRKKWMPATVPAADSGVSPTTNTQR